MSYLKAKKVNYPSIHKITSFRELKGIEWFELVRCLISSEPPVIKSALSKSVRKLATDIQSNGLINPILIYANKVIYGMQRSVVAKYLNYDSISCYYCESEDQVERIHKEQIKNDSISI